MQVPRTSKAPGSYKRVMYIACNNCGQPIEEDHLFCRSCGSAVKGADGFTLARSAAAAAGAQSVQPLGPGRSYRSLQVGLIMCFAGLMIGVCGKMLFHVEAVTLVGVLMNFVGMFLLVYPSIRPRSAERSPRTVDAVVGSGLPVAPTTRKLTTPAEAVGFTSVTEGTTNLLTVPASSQRRD